MRPATGARCTCTFQIDRKMLMRCPIVESSTSSTIYDHVAVGGRNDRAGIGRNRALGIAEKIKNEKPQKNQDSGGPFPAGIKTCGAHNQRRDRKFVRFFDHGEGKILAHSVKSTMRQVAAEHAFSASRSGVLFECTCIVRQKCERHSALVTDRLLMAGENQFHPVLQAQLELLQLRFLNQIFRTEVGRLEDLLLAGIHSGSVLLRGCEILDLLPTGTAVYPGLYSASVPSWLVKRSHRQ